MTDELLSALISIAVAIVGVAIISLLVSSKSDTTGVLTAAGTALGYLFGEALNPISNAGASALTLS